MTDYSKTKIYKIESHLGDKIYIGSTAKQYLSQRFQQHKQDYTKWKKGKSGKVMSYALFDEYGPENCQIILIEEYPCSSKDAKNAKESHYIRTLDCVNKNIPGRTSKQYYEDHKEDIKKYREDHKEESKKYREDHKEDLLKNAKEYYEKNKDNIQIKTKQYRDDNKETILEKKKKYYMENKEKILSQVKQRYQKKKAEKLEEENKSNQL